MFEDSDYSEEEDTFMKKALDVNLPDDFDPNIIPQNGEEYIQLVMYEAKRCKRWVAAEVDESKFSEPTVLITMIDECIKAPQYMLPSRKWQEQKVEDFTKFRKFLESKITEEPCYEVIHESHWTDRINTEVPSFSIISTLSQSTKIKLLQLIVNNLSLLRKGESISYENCVWIYGILSTLGVPLCPHLCYCIRELARRCSKIRSDLPLNCPEDKYLPLNLFICIVALYFKQLDLVD